MKFSVKILTILSAMLLCLNTLSILATPSTAPDLVCIGATKTYTVNNTPGSTYHWQINGGGPLGSTSNSVNITWTTPGNYTVSVQETRIGDNCKGDVITLPVTVEAPPVINLSSATVCAGENLVFTTATISGATYTWTNGGVPVTGQTGNVYSIVNPSAGTINVGVTAHTLAGCVSNTPIVQGTVKPLPVVNLAATVGRVCFGNDLVFEATGNATSYQWMADNHPMAETGNILTIPTYAPGNTPVSVRGFKDGCEAVSQTVVGIAEDTPPTPRVNDLITCAAPGAIDVSSLVTSPSNILWYLGASTPSRITPSRINTNIVGSKTYYASAISTTGCESARVPVYIEVNENPAIISKTKSGEKEITVVAASGTAPYVYKIQNVISNPFLSTTQITELTSGNNVFIVEDAKGCQVKDSLTILFNDLVPEAYFSPNGDGDNDTWDILNIEKYPRTEIFIHDRYGKELYKATAATFKGWDGIYRGHPVVGSDYWYVINVYELGQRMVGHFNLRR